MQCMHHFVLTQCLRAHTSFRASLCTTLVLKQLENIKARGLQLQKLGRERLGAEEAGMQHCFADATLAR
eukprot:scaffold310843_cov24-Tisochrysis_lutea.AAC.1